MKKYLPSSIFGPKMVVLENHSDDMECIVKCLNCGKATKYGLVRMISGYVGCDNEIEPGVVCFDDLAKRVILAKENKSEEYGKEQLYKCLDLASGLKTIDTYKSIL